MRHPLLIGFSVQDQLLCNGISFLWLFSKGVSWQKLQNTSSFFAGFTRSLFRGFKSPAEGKALLTAISPPLSVYNQLILFYGLLLRGQNPASWHALDKLLLCSVLSRSVCSRVFVYMFHCLRPFFKNFLLKVF